MGKISGAIPHAYPFMSQCITAVYGRGNYTVSGGYNSCTSFGSLYTSTGNYQKIEVYNERCYFNGVGQPDGGCPQQPDRVYIGGLTNSCNWVALHVPGQSSLVSPSIIKNFDIEPVFCGGAICSQDSCRVDCAIAPDGFCCIDHLLTDRLLQVLAN